jgi:hypothetical protein
MLYIRIEQDVTVKATTKTATRRVRLFQGQVFQVYIYDIWGRPQDDALVTGFRLRGVGRVVLQPECWRFVNSGGPQPSIN